MSSAYVYAAKRTPFGRFGGALSGVRPDDLAVAASRGLLDTTPDLDPARICIGVGQGLAVVLESVQ